MKFELMNYNNGLTNLLLLGRTGSGKSYLCRALIKPYAKYFDKAILFVKHEQEMWKKTLKGCKNIIIKDEIDFEYIESLGKRNKKKPILLLFDDQSGEACVINKKFFKMVIDARHNMFTVIAMSQSCTSYSRGARINMVTIAINVLESELNYLYQQAPLGADKKVLREKMGRVVKYNKQDPKKHGRQALIISSADIQIMKF